MSNNDVIDDFITEIRKYGVTRLSEETGVSRATLHYWIRHKVTPTLDKAQLVADAMGFEFLLFEKET